MRWVFSAGVGKKSLGGEFGAPEVAGTLRPHPQRRFRRSRRVATGRPSGPRRSMRRSANGTPMRLLPDPYASFASILRYVACTVVSVVPYMLARRGCSSPCDCKPTLETYAGRAPPQRTRCGVVGWWGALPPRPPRQMRGTRSASGRGQLLPPVLRGHGMHPRPALSVQEPPRGGRRAEVRPIAPIPRRRTRSSETGSTRRLHQT